VTKATRDSVVEKDVTVETRRLITHHQVSARGINRGAIEFSRIAVQKRCLATQYVSEKQGQSNKVSAAPPRFMMSKRSRSIIVTLGEIADEKNETKLFLLLRVEYLYP
jgi:hypothetical protein